MDFDLLSIYKQYAEIAVIISLLLNITISIIGIVPSFFLTFANIIFFGFWYGTIVSIAGEVLGAIVSFALYRVGFKRLSHRLQESKYELMQKLLHTKGKEAFFLIFAFRLFPFVPSGLVNIFAALGKVSIPIFVIASTAGKVPALLLEAYSVHQLIQFSWQGKLLLTFVAIYFFIISLKRIMKSKK